MTTHHHLIPKFSGTLLLHVLYAFLVWTGTFALLLLLLLSIRNIIYNYEVYQINYECQFDILVNFTVIVMFFNNVFMNLFSYC